MIRFLHFDAKIAVISCNRKGESKLGLSAHFGCLLITFARDVKDKFSGRQGISTTLNDLTTRKFIPF